MLFNTHSNLAGSHAFLSPSNYHWVNYDVEEFDKIYVARLAAQRGTELHAFAHQAIRLGIKMAKTRTTLNLYINDAIGYRMTPEQVLFYSPHCYGTVDTISFRQNTLRIHDLKTGKNDASPHQLEVYAALFCLEYNYKPNQISTELRIYQSNEVRVYEGDPDAIFHVMDRIVTFDKRIEMIRREALL